LLKDTGIEGATSELILFE